MEFPGELLVILAKDRLFRAQKVMLKKQCNPPVEAFLLMSDGQGVSLPLSIEDESQKAQQTKKLQFFCWKFKAEGLMQLMMGHEHRMEPSLSEEEINEALSQAGGVKNMPGGYEVMVMIVASPERIETTLTSMVIREEKGRVVGFGEIKEDSESKSSLVLPWAGADVDRKMALADKAADLVMGARSKRGEKKVPSKKGRVTLH